jgi:hypothetical protein
MKFNFIQTGISEFAKGSGFFNLQITTYPQYRSENNAAITNPTTTANKTRPQNSVILKHLC